MHPKEFKKERLGTGKMTRTAFAGSELHVDVDFTESRSVNGLITDPANFCAVLWPGVGALAWSGPEGLPAQLIGKRLVVFLLDGTWSCARKMYRMSANLQALPKIAFEPSEPSRFRIKQQPDVRCLSTVETTRLLFKEMECAGLEEQQDWDALLRPFEELNDRQIAIAADPARRGYRRGVYRPENTFKRALEGTRKRRLF
jgi:DTW domain-containing protein YfiP